MKKAKYLLLDEAFDGLDPLIQEIVKEEIERLGGRFIGSLVAYDGSKYKEDNVWSLYRYYDYHDLLGRPLK